MLHTWNMTSFRNIYGSPNLQLNDLTPFFYVIKCQTALYGQVPRSFHTPNIFLLSNYILTCFSKVHKHTKECFDIKELSVKGHDDKLLSEHM